MPGKVITLIISLCLFQGCSSNPIYNIGFHDQQLQPCPSSPNCVSSFASHKSHYISPINILNGSSKHNKQAIPFVQERLLSILEHDSSANIITNTPDYLHIEFKSNFFGFIDDTEFYFPQGLIHMRSASRLGYSDFGVNRKRLENIRKLLEDVKAK